MESWSLIEQICQAKLEDLSEALKKPEQRQSDILRTILAENVSSVFGQQHRFSEIQDYADYTAQVPIADYADFQAAITLTAEGEPQHLTAAEVIQFEETSGSSSGAKLVPYTKGLLLAFQRAILPWLGDLLQHRPGITRGRVFFMISPALRPSVCTAGGIPVGIGNDLGYFGQNLAAHLAQVTLYSSALEVPQTADSWKKQTALLLLQATDLTLISLWSPTLLLELIDYIMTHYLLLLKEITDEKQRINLGAAISDTGIDTQKIWPLLDTISCWDSHTSAVHAQRLQQLFPHVFIQGKGLLSTESVTSLPYSKANSPILAINSHFYEFLAEDNSVFLAHQLVIGKSYRVIVTTQSGLYRYDTGDMVKVSGYYHNTPTLVFMGREGLNSDLCGEKLTDAFVAQAIESVDSALIGQSLLLAVNDAKPHYCWVVASDVIQADSFALVTELEQALCQNPQYQYARNMGQLGALRIRAVADVIRCYQQQTAHNPTRLGTMKLPALLPVTSYAEG